jgi:SprT protein
VTDKDQYNLAKLSRYLPDGTADSVFEYLKNHNVSLKIKKPRISKLGDYRHPRGKFGHRISVNGNMNKYSFLITLVHEMAHLETWIQKGNKTEPHGKDWKENFQVMLSPLVSAHVLPNTVVNALNSYLKNPRASSCSDLNLSRALATFDDNELPTVEMLKEGSIFILNNGKVFRKGPKLRKRYKCLCLTDDKWYYVNPVVNVKVEQETTISTN